MSQTSPAAEQTASKVPHVTLAFWIVKILATTLGETGGDALSMQLGLGYLVSTLIFLVAFAVAAAVQIAGDRYHPLRYWACVVATTTVGTTTSDFFDRTLGLGYVASSALLLAAVIAILVVWRRTTGSIAVDPITSRTNEAYYWLTILVSNTLGTALGDFTADDLGFGFGGGALLFAALLAGVAVLHFRTTIATAVLFWAAYVLTRPLGATLGDTLTKPHDAGGLALGRIESSLVILALMALAIWYTERLGARARVAAAVAVVGTAALLALAGAPATARAAASPSPAASASPSSAAPAPATPPPASSSAKRPLPSAPFGATAEYAVVARWPLGGSGGWDLLALDAPRHRLYVTRGDHVDVVDTTTGTVAGRIGPTAGAHGIAIADDLQRGFVTSGRTHSLLVFDAATLAVEREVALPGENPDAIAYVARTGRVFVFDGRSREAIALDARTLEVLQRIPLPGKPELARVDGHDVYVNIESEPGQLVRIDARTLAVTASWPLPGCTNPTGLALDTRAARLYSACEGGVLAVTDLRNGAPVARLAIGEGPDGAEVDAARGTVLSPNGASGTLTVIAAGGIGYRVAATLPTQRGARTSVLDAASGRIYLFTADYGPPPPASAEDPQPRAKPIDGSHVVLVVEPR